MRSGVLRAAITWSSSMPHHLLLVAAGGLTSALALSLSGDGPPHLLTLLLLAPLLEETVFRAGLQEALLLRWQTRPRLTNAATAAVFAIAHMALRGDVSAVSVALPALLIGEVYQRTGSLRLCVALHATMNAAWLGWSTAGPVLLGGR